MGNSDGALPRPVVLGGPGGESGESQTCMCRV